MVISALVPPLMSGLTSKVVFSPLTTLRAARSGDRVWYTFRPGNESIFLEVSDSVTVFQDIPKCFGNIKFSNLLENLHL